MAELFTPKVDAASFAAVKKMLASGKTHKQVANKTKLGLTTIQAIGQTDSLQHYRERLQSREKIRKLQRRLAEASKGSIAMVRKAEEAVRAQERGKRRELLVAYNQEQHDNTTLAKAALWGWGLAVLFLAAAIVIFVVK